tara:strand:- start:266 stop:460 length:195 start_codon:yes stop_codon:yes gene_type:complete
MPKYAVTVVGEITKVIEVVVDDADDARETAESHFSEWLQNHEDNLWKYVDSYNAQTDVEEADGN